MSRAATTDLSADDVERYWRDGYLILESVFAADEITRMGAEADRIRDLVINASFFHGTPDVRLDGRVRGEQLDLRKIQPINDLSDELAAASRDPRLINPMRELMGDEPVLMEEKLNYKELVDVGGGARAAMLTARSGETKFWLHHDWGYYRTEGYPENTMSSAISIDESEGRGPIRVLPGSHLHEWPLKYETSGILTDEAAATIDDADLVPIHAPAGSVMLFHAKLVHDSSPNPTALPRRLMIYSHYPASHDDGDPDRRNGPFRQIAREFEQAYLDSLG